jgi:LPXTG-motif cell wall-anchored protein
MLVLIGAALLSVPALASAAPTPYPPTNPSSGVAPSSASVAPTSAQRTQATSQSDSHGTNDAGTASTGFQTLTATAIAIVLLAGGAGFVLLGRRRRHT